MSFFQIMLRSLTRKSRTWRQPISSKSIAVLGAGVIGLTTAYDLLERGYEVHIYSEDWSPNLTSNVAVGIWSPLSLSSDIPKEKRELHQQMLAISEQRFLKSSGDHPEFAGVRIIYHYNLKGSPHTASPASDAEEVTVHFDNGLVKDGWRRQMLGIDGKLFMEDLYSKVKIKGALLHQKHFESKEDLLDLNESIIVNCMSYGSRQVFNDQEFIPVRGQLVYFSPQEGIDYSLFEDAPRPHYFVLIYPWSDRLILGGVYEIGEEAPVVEPEVTNEMIQNAQAALL
jgi:D-amino-acid oxidase